MTTLLALYRRPEGGADALATFERRYREEHLPLVAQTPGLRATRVQRVDEALGGETDLVLVTAMDFDDRAALDAGLASDAMRAAGREPARDRARDRHAASCSRTRRTSPEPRSTKIGLPVGSRVWILSGQRGGAAVTDSAPIETAPRPSGRVHRRHVSGRRPGRASRRRRARSRSIVPPRSTHSTSPCSTSLHRALERLDADPACRAIVLTGAGNRAFAAGADIKELAEQTPVDPTARQPLRRVGPDRGDPDAARSPPSAVSRWAAAASWRWPAT